MINLTGDDSFVIFQKPEDEKIFFGRGKWKSIEDKKDSFKEQFIIQLFNKETYHLEGEIEEVNEQLEVLHPIDFNLDSTLKSTYESGVKSIIKKCEKAILHKCIVSRVVVEKHGLNNIFSFFKNLTEKYKHGFIYLLNHPKFGMWIGVSPEKLLVGDKKNGYQSQALAGSKSIDSIKSWTLKEKEEHNYVANYIKEIIEQDGEVISESKTYNKSAGNLEHLNKDFHFKIKSQLLSFVNKLHPTPAIAGIPLKESLQCIEEIEEHSRQLYCGLIGIINKDKCELYVNLRCGRLTPNTIQLFVGGGITAKSKVEDEFLETEIKSQTLLSVIKKM